MGRLGFSSLTWKVEIILELTCQGCCEDELVHMLLACILSPAFLSNRLFLSSHTKCPATPASALFLKPTKWAPSSGPLHQLFPPPGTPYPQTNDVFPYFLQVFAQTTPFKRDLPPAMSFKIELLILFILFLLYFSSLPLALLYIVEWSVTLSSTRI